jgi:uncharacterized membrane protein
MSRLARRLPELYLLFALPLLTFLAVNTPLFIFADEHTHVLRAEMIAEGHLVAHRTDDGQSGAEVDGNLLKLMAVYLPLLTEENKRVTPELREKAKTIFWGGQQIFVHVPNTAIYPPFFYAPITGGLMLGKTLQTSVQNSVVLARLCTLAVSLVLSYLALRLLPRGRYLLFAVLLLPMTLAQMAACSQDSLLLSCAALLTALVVRPLTKERAASVGEVAAMALLIALLSLARPTFLSFCLLLFLVRYEKRPLLSAAALSGLIVAVNVAWIAYVSAKVMVMQTVLGFTPDMPAQMRWMLAHPAAFPFAMVKNLLHFGWGLWVAFIALIGYGHGGFLFPDYYYPLTSAMLLAAAIATITEGRGMAPLPALGVWIAVIGSFIGIYLAQYLSFTEVGGDEVRGVQGRYFTPLVMMAGMALPWWQRLAKATRACHTAATLPVVLFPLLTLVLLPLRIISVYYVR